MPVVRLLDMPSLIDQSEEQCASLTCNDSNNNKPPYASLHFDKKNLAESHLDTDSSVNKFDSDQLEPLKSNYSLYCLDEISEFLVFHKKTPSMSMVINNDEKLKNGCFVKLMKIEIPKTVKLATQKNKRVRKSSKRKLTNSANRIWLLPEKAKRRSKFGPRSDHLLEQLTRRSSPRNFALKNSEKKCETLKHSTKSARPVRNVKNKTLCATDAVIERPKLVFRLVRQTDSPNSYYCYEVGKQQQAFESVSMSFQNICRHFVDF